MKDDSTAEAGVVLLSTADWDATLLTNKQHTARALGELGLPVLYVESMGLRRPHLRRSDVVRIWRRLRRIVEAPRQVDDLIWRWSPPSIPLQHIRVVRLVNRFLVSSLLWFWASRILPRKRIVWTYNPMTTALIRIPDGVEVVYHCVDDIASQPGMPVADMRMAERDLVRKARHVFVTSPALHARWSEIAEVMYDPNCVDVCHFDAPDVQPDALIGAVPHPRIGFVGAIASYKLDIDLMLQTFTSRPDWHLVLVGPKEDNCDITWRLLSLDNVHYLGVREYSQLPSVMRFLDVGLIPARQNEYTRSMFPMKFFEYLASSIPVVATQLNSLSDFSDAAVLTPTSGFEEGIQRVLDGGHPDPAVGLAICRENTYSLRTRRQLRAIGLIGIDR